MGEYREKKSVRSALRYLLSALRYGRPDENRWLFDRAAAALCKAACLRPEDDL